MRLDRSAYNIYMVSKEKCLLRFDATGMIYTFNTLFSSVARMGMDIHREREHIL